MVDPTNGSAVYTYDAVGNILSVVRKPASSIVVAGVSPSRGVTGAQVTIAGTGFGTTSNTTVSFNGAATSVTSVTSTQIVVSVPSGAKTGAVSVTSPAGTAASATNFTVSTNTGPVIASFSPTQTDQGATLTISGTGFDTSANNNKVQINGRFANVTAATATSLKVTVPASATGPVRVTTSQGSSTSTTNAVIPPLPYVASQIGSVSNGSIGQSSTVNVGSAGQIALVTVPVQAGQRLSLYVSNASFGSAMAGVYGPDGSAVIMPIGISSGASTGTVVFATAGYYTIVVAPASGQTGSATLILLADVSSSISIDGPSVSLTTTSPGQNMSLTFTGTANQRVTLSNQITGGNLSGCSVVSILRPDGSAGFYSNNSNCSGNGYSDVIVLPLTGTYTIGYDPAGDTTGTVNFTVQSVPPDAKGTASIDGGTVSLTTTASGQNMSLTFTGTANQRIALAYQVTGGNLGGCSWLNLLEPDGSTSLYSGNGNCGGNIYTDVLILPVSGTYTIYYDPSGSTTGTASFTVQSVPPDAKGTVSIDGGTVSLTTTASGQNMSLTFTGTANQRITLAYQVTGGNLGGCSSLNLLEPDGSTSLYSGNGNCGGNIYTDVLILPVSGTYTIYYDPSGSTTGTASFTVQSVPPDARATITPGGGSIGVTITQGGQNAALSFNGTTGRRVSLLSQFDSGLSSTCRNIQVLQPDGSTQLYSTLSCASSDFSGVLPRSSAVTGTVPTLSTSGTYQVTLNPNGTATGTATFTLYDVPPDVSGSTTLGAAATSYSTTTPGQSVRVTFPGRMNGSASINVALTNSSQSSCFTVTVLQPDGTTALRGDQSCNSSYSSGSLSLPADGTYTVVVSPGGTMIGTFSIGGTTP